MSDVRFLRRHLRRWPGCWCPGDRDLRAPAIALRGRGPPGEDAFVFGRCSSRSAGRRAHAFDSTVLKHCREPHSGADGSTSLSPSRPSTASAHPGSPGVPCLLHPARLPARPARRDGVARPACPAPGSRPSRTAARPICGPRPARRGARRRRRPSAPRRGPRLLPRGPRHQHPADRLGRRSAGPQRRLVLVSAIAPFRDVRGQVRAAHARERHALPGGAREHPVEVASERDVKGLYAASAKGRSPG